MFWLWDWAIAFIYGMLVVARLAILVGIFCSCDFYNNVLSFSVLLDHFGVLVCKMFDL